MQQPGGQTLNGGAGNHWFPDGDGPEHTSFTTMFTVSGTFPMQIRLACLLIMLMQSFMSS